MRYDMVEVKILGHKGANRGVRWGVDGWTGGCGYCSSRERGFIGGGANNNFLWPKNQDHHVTWSFFYA